MLKKTQRLSNVLGLKGAKSFSSPFLVVKFSENGESTNRFAFVISKKIDKRAVIRNRLKRSLSKNIEEMLDILKPGYSIVIITKPGILEKDTKENSEILKDLFSKAGLIK